MMNGLRRQIKEVLERELGVRGNKILEEFLNSKKEELSEEKIEDLEDRVFEKVKENYGIERAEEIVDSIKKIRLSNQLEESRESSKSRIQCQSRYEVLKELGNVCLNLNQLKEAENYFGKMFEISEELGREKMIIDSLVSEAELYLVMDELSKVEENVRKIIELSKESGDRVMEGEGIKLAGIIAWRKGDHQEGMNYLNDSLEIFKERGLKEKTASVYRELGDLHVDAEDYEKGVEYYEKAAEIFGAAEMFYERTNMLLEIGIILSEIEENGAIEYLQLAEEESLENSFFDFAAWSSLNLGEIYLEKNRCEKAEEKSRKALELFEKIGDKHGEGGAKLTLGRLIAGRGELLEAEIVLKDAINIFRKLGLPESEAEARYRLAEVQKEESKRNQAEANLEEALKIYDSLDITEMKEDIEKKLADLTK